jgi:hypothetical protein
VFPVRYKLNSYMSRRSNSVFIGFWEGCLEFRVQALSPYVWTRGLRPEGVGGGAQAIRMFSFVGRLTTPSVAQTVECLWKDDWRTMDWKGFGRKQPLPNLGRYPS